MAKKTSFGHQVGNGLLMAILLTVIVFSVLVVLSKRGIIDPKLWSVVRGALQ